MLKNSDEKQVLLLVILRRHRRNPSSQAVEENEQEFIKSHFKWRHVQVSAYIQIQKQFKTKDPMEIHSNKTKGI